MLSKEVVELSKQHSIIRDIFEYGMKRAKEVGAENVFDFSIGNPSVPAPKEIDETALRLLKTARSSGYSWIYKQCWSTGSKRKHCQVFK